MYSNTAIFGKICVLCIQKAPQSAVGECTARASCRQGASSPSEALESRTAHESCHPLTDLPLRRGCIDAHLQHCAGTDGPAPAQGLLPEQLHRGIVFQRPGPCAGMASHTGRGSRTLLNGLALAQGVPTPQRPANARHLPIPATCRAHHSQRQAVDELRRRPSGAWPTVLPSPEGPPTTPSRRAGRQRNAAQNWA